MSTVPKSSGKVADGLMRAAIAATCMAAATSAIATEWFVDHSRLDDSGEGLSELTAKRTIQAAVNAASAGDIITVLPGVYDEGLTETTYEGQDGFKLRCRVFIDKRLTLRSRDGAKETHIVGLHDPETENNSSYYGTGPNAIRCIGFTNNTAAANSVVEGFTIRDGASIYESSDKFAAYGGGVLCPGWGGGSSISVVDCVISNCVATRGGGLSNVSLVRSLVTCCRASSNGAAGRYVWGYNCVFSKNRNFNGNPQSSNVLSYSSKIVNCDIIENNMYTIDSSTKVYNSLFFGNQGDSGNLSTLSEKCSNCLSDIEGLTSGGCVVGTYSTSVFAPAAGDFRVVSGGAADGSGNVSYLDEIPSAYRGTDYCGNSRKTEETVNVGAVEGRGVSRGLFVFKGIGTTSLADLHISVGDQPELLRNTHVNVESVPSPIRIRIRTESGENEVLRVRCSDNSHSFYPEWDGSIVLTPFSSGVEYSIAEIIRGSTTVYADANAVGATEDGSADYPYHTLQAAVDAVGDDNGVILLKPGHYNKGVAPPVGECTVSNRCDFAGSGWCLVRAVEGPDETFVHGRAASDSPTGDGRGADAVRCICKTGTGRVIVSGVTLCDGRTGTSGGDGAKGGAVFASVWNGNSNIYFIDCVVSNNVAESGGVGYANAGLLAFIRCRITANRAPEGELIRGCTCVNSLFYGNGAEEEVCTAIGEGASAYNCTVYGSALCAGFDASCVEKVVNCVFDGAEMDKIGISSGISISNTLYATSTEEEDLSGNNVVQSDSVMTAPSAGDFRLTTLSPAKELASLAEAFWGMNFPLDVYGNAYAVDPYGRYPAGAVAAVIPAVRVASRRAGSPRLFDGMVSPCGLVLLESSALTLVPTGDTRLLGYEVDGVFHACSGSNTFDIDLNNPPSSIVACYADAGFAIIMR